MLLRPVWLLLLIIQLNICEFGVDSDISAGGCSADSHEDSRKIVTSVSG